MSDNWLKRVTVRPIDDASEVLQYQALIEQHHYLGWCKPVGARILYVAEVDGDWVALITWAAAALKSWSTRPLVGGQSAHQSGETPLHCKQHTLSGFAACT